MIVVLEQVKKKIQLRPHRMKLLLSHNHSQRQQLKQMASKSDAALLNLNQKQILTHLYFLENQNSKHF